MRKTYYIRLENNWIKTSKRKPREADCLVPVDVIDGKLKMGVKKIIKVSENPEDLVDEFIIKWDENIYPSKMHNLCKFCFNNNFKEARKIHFNNLNLMNLLFCEVNPVPIKSAMNIMGYNVGKCRLPLGDINVDNYKELNNVLKKTPKK